MREGHIESSHPCVDYLSSFEALFLLVGNKRLGLTCLMKIMLCNACENRFICYSVNS